MATIFIREGHTPWVERLPDYPMMEAAGRSFAGCFQCRVLANQSIDDAIAAISARASGMAIEAYGTTPWTKRLG